MLYTLAAALLVASTAQAQAVMSSATRVNVSDYTNSLRAGWSTSNGQGVFTDGLTMLQAGSGGNSTSSTSLAGLLLQFNSTLGMAGNNTSSGIPFVALVSCDASPMTTLDGNNSTSASNTSTPTNSTLNSTQSLNVLQLATQLGSVAVVLYSTQNQSCVLNSTTNATSSIPVFTLPAQSHAALLLEQFDNVDFSNRFYNATLLAESLANLTSLLPTIAAGILPQTGFLLAQVQPNATDNTSPVVANVGRASTSLSVASQTSSATGTAPSASQSSQPASGASSWRTGGAGALAAVAGAVGVWIQM